MRRAIYHPNGLLTRTNNNLSYLIEGKEKMSNQQTRDIHPM